MGVALARRPFITAAPLVLGGMGAMCLEAHNASIARADEVTTDEVTEETARYINYLDGLQFEELATVAFTEDGYWGTATTMVWQKWAFHYDSSYTATGLVLHQWQANISANPGLTSGWYCDSTLAGDSLIRFIQSYSGSGESDGILGTNTVKAIQTCLGTVVDGVFSAPSTAIRVMQTNFSRAGIPW